MSICCKKELKIKKLELTSTVNHFSRLIEFSQCRNCQSTKLTKRFTDVYGIPKEPVLVEGKKAKRDLDLYINQKIDKALIWKVPKKNNPMIGVCYHSMGKEMRLDDTVFRKVLEQRRFVLYKKKKRSFLRVFKNNSFLLNLKALNLFRIFGKYIKPGYIL